MWNAAAPADARAAPGAPRCVLSCLCPAILLLDVGSHIAAAVAWQGAPPCFCSILCLELLTKLAAMLLCSLTNIGNKDLLIHRSEWVASLVQLCLYCCNRRVTQDIDGCGQGWTSVGVSSFRLGSCCDNFISAVLEHLPTVLSLTELCLNGVIRSHVPSLSLFPQPKPADFAKAFLSVVASL